MNTMDENAMDKQSSPKSSLLDGWNAPPNLVTYSRIVLVVIFLALVHHGRRMGCEQH